MNYLTFRTLKILIRLLFLIRKVFDYKIRYMRKSVAFFTKGKLDQHSNIQFLQNVTNLVFMHYDKIGVCRLCTKYFTLMCSIYQEIAMI